ncbi:MAG: cytochrome c maturation protein CcmE [Zoogloeaceae bacterium]|jgi:cytochrome c-type biogenesis protein CcmE|nr:cytochrome c maturation protein CcmE [Zoogloeaceae bacterium]
MKARHQRLCLIVAALVVLGVITGFVFYALGENVSAFYSPTEVAEGKAPQNRFVRIGGLVQTGSFTRLPDGVSVRFKVVDHAHEINVRYTGILPDLFREGRGAVALGKFENGDFVASEVLAKHDENYMPPEVADALQKSHQEATGQTVPPAQP